MNLDLTGKHALVGGSSRGIGLATAHELAALGASVTLLARTEASLREALAALPTPQRHEGQTHNYCCVDASDTDALRETVALLVAAKPVHILVNNTGGPPPGPAHTATPEQYLAAFRQHLLANQTLATLVIEGMKADGYGRIINIISTSVKQPLDGLGVSNTVRGAVASWAKTMANELAAFGITVNNVLPGATRTERLEQILTADAAKHGITREAMATQMQTAIPMRRFAEAGEVAAAVAFLASPAAAYITGINIPVDGGRTKSL